MRCRRATAPLIAAALGARGRSGGRAPALAGAGAAAGVGPPPNGLRARRGDDARRLLGP